MSELMPHKMQNGRTYRVVYKNPSDRLPREMIGNFMGSDEPPRIDLYFDLRPIAGTTRVPIEWVLEVWESDREMQIPTIYRGETRVF